MPKDPYTFGWSDDDDDVQVIPQPRPRANRPPRGRGNAGGPGRGNQHQQQARERSRSPVPEAFANAGRGHRLHDVRGDDLYQRVMQAPSNPAYRARAPQPPPGQRGSGSQVAPPQAFARPDGSKDQSSAGQGASYGNFPIGGGGGARPRAPPATQRPAADSARKEQPSSAKLHAKPAPSASSVAASDAAKRQALAAKYDMPERMDPLEVKSPLHFKFPSTDDDTVVSKINHDMNAKSSSRMAGLDVFPPEVLDMVILDFLCYEFVQTLYKEWECTEKLAWLDRKIRRMKKHKESEGDTDRELERGWDQDEHDCGAIYRSLKAESPQGWDGSQVRRDVLLKDFEARRNLVEQKASKCFYRVEEVGKLIQGLMQKYPSKPFLNGDALEAQAAPALRVRYTIMELLKTWIQWRPPPGDDDLVEVIKEEDHRRRQNFNIHYRENMEAESHKGKYEDMPTTEEFKQTLRLYIELTGQYYDVCLEGDLGDEEFENLPKYTLNYEWFEAMEAIMTQIAIRAIVETFGTPDPAAPTEVRSSPPPGQKPEDLRQLLNPIFADDNFTGDDLFLKNKIVDDDVAKTAKLERDQVKVDLIEQFAKGGVEAVQKFAASKREYSYQYALREIEGFTRVIWKMLSVADTKPFLQNRHVGLPILVKLFKNPAGKTTMPRAAFFHSYQDLETAAAEAMRDRPHASNPVRKQPTVTVTIDDPPPAPASGIKGPARRVMKQNEPFDVDQDDDVVDDHMFDYSPTQPTVRKEKETKPQPKPDPLPPPQRNMVPGPAAKKDGARPNLVMALNDNANNGGAAGSTAKAKDIVWKDAKAMKAGGAAAPIDRKANLVASITGKPTNPGDGNKPKPAEKSSLNQNVDAFRQSREQQTQEQQLRGERQKLRNLDRSMEPIMNGGMDHDHNVDPRLRQPTSPITEPGTGSPGVKVVLEQQHGELALEISTATSRGMTTVLSPREGELAINISTAVNRNPRPGASNDEPEVIRRPNVNVKKPAQRSVNPIVLDDIDDNPSGSDPLVGYGDDQSPKDDSGEESEPRKKKQRIGE